MTSLFAATHPIREMVETLQRNIRLQVDSQLAQGSIGA